MTVTTKSLEVIGKIAKKGHLVRLWRPPLGPGEWRSIGLFNNKNCWAEKVSFAISFFLHLLEVRLRN